MSEPGHRDESTHGHYTFGDNAIASARLQRLADLFRPSLEAELAQIAAGRAGQVIVEYSMGEIVLERR